jgi:hypothetical protein
LGLSLSTISWQKVGNNITVLEGLISHQDMPLSIGISRAKQQIDPGFESLKFEVLKRTMPKKTATILRTMGAVLDC